jgi:5-methylcytosine-specific restriction endonuclease McrA
MMLPPKLPKKPKRETRWRSQAHCNFVRGHACSVCFDTAPIEVAHVRIASGAGMGQKPDDWRTVSLCRNCHRRQHEMGEGTFWTERDIEALIDAFCKASPKAAEIARIRSERNV